MTPLYIIEEHHEAFYIWHKAIADGHLPPTGNALLHVDHHPDFEGGPYGCDLAALPVALDGIKDFTYSCLGVADFICPAIYQGIFDEVAIVKDYSRALPAPEEHSIRLNAEGCLAVEKVIPFLRDAMAAPGSGRRLFTLRQGGLGDYSGEKPLALDIDLDYFCWDDSLSSVADKRLEITEEAYYELTANPYHPFRLFPKAWLRPIADGGRFYLAYLGLPMPTPPTDEERIIKRMALFADWLSDNKITPVIISICRSRHSGYTPVSVWEFIEKELLIRLSEVYDYEMCL